MPTTLRLTFGVIFFLLGIVGSLLPVLQGWMFFLLAAVMLFPKHPRVERLLARAEAKMPRTVEWLRRRGIGADRATLD
ncbi:MAG: DUF454 family protein [Thermoanaerobaculia bacterium]|jgi:uncharacterized membrane protein YbaN (DUF454 family)